MVGHDGELRQLLVEVRDNQPLSLQSVTIGRVEIGVRVTIPWVS